MRRVLLLSSGSGSNILLPDPFTAVSTLATARADPVAFRASNISALASPLFNCVFFIFFFSDQCPLSGLYSVLHSSCFRVRGSDLCSNGPLSFTGLSMRVPLCSLLTAQIPHFAPNDLRVLVEVSSVMFFVESSTWPWPDVPVTVESSARSRLGGAVM